MNQGGSGGQAAVSLLGAHGQLGVLGHLWLEPQAMSNQMGQTHPGPKTLRYFRVRGLAPRSSETGHGGVWVLGHLLPERSWMGRADRSGGIAKPTLTSSIKPHFMEPCTLSSRTSRHHQPLHLVPQPG